MTKKITEKRSELNAVIAGVDKRHGKGSLMWMNTRAEIDPSQIISTHSLLLDNATGIGGFPRGRIVEIYGPESSGKTTLALHVIQEAQKNGGVCAFIDAEHALDTTYASNIGVDVKNILLSQPDSGEAALDITEALVASDAVDVIVIDSVAALTPKAELEGDMGDMQIGLQARLMSKALRKLTPKLSQSNTLIVFINQIRMKIGAYGNPETTAGGNALKFFSSIRVELRKSSSLKKGDMQIGSEVKAKIVKNKLAPPFKVANFEIYYGEGISKEAEVIELALRSGVLQKSGTFIKYQDKTLAQGKDNLRQVLKDDAALMKDIFTAAKEAIQRLNNTKK